MQTMDNSPAIAAAFRVLEGPLKGKKYLFETNIVTIGRSDEANIPVLGDRSVSRIHAEVHLVEGHYVLQNRSDGGTFVNDKLVEKRVLQSGDRIRIGEIHLLDFTEINSAAAASTGPKLGRPKLLIGGAVYLLLLGAVAVFLSASRSSEQDTATGQQLQEVVNQYMAYTSEANMPKEGQEAQARVVEAYLRAGLIAEREGRYDEARQVYLQLLELIHERKNPVYQYALVQLRKVPETR